MLLAPVPVIALIAIGVASGYAGRRLASRASSPPIRMALFSVGAIGAAASIVAGLLALAVGVVLLAGAS